MYSIKKMIILLYLLFTAISFSFGQTTSANALKDTKWHKVLGHTEYREEVYDMEFTTMSIKHTITWPLIGKSRSGSDLYYISNSIPSKFDTSKVGSVSTKGKYIVKRLYDKTMVVYELISISSDTLKVRPISDNTMYDSPIGKIDVIDVYVRKR